MPQEKMVDATALYSENGRPLLSTVFLLDFTRTSKYYLIGNVSYISYAIVKEACGRFCQFFIG